MKVATALATIRGQKEITSSLRNAFFELSQVEMTQGISVDEAGTAKINKREDSLKVTDNLGTLEVTITGTPDNNDEIYLRNEAGEVKKATNSAGKVTVPTLFAKEGESLSATYKEEVIGNVLTLSSETFSDAHTLEYHTIGYSPSTNQVVSDIYIQLDHVIPKGEFELNFENGSAIAPEFTFDSMVAPNTTEMGRIIEVPRA